MKSEKHGRSEVVLFQAEDGKKRNRGQTTIDRLRPLRPGRCCFIALTP